MSQVGKTSRRQLLMAVGGAAVAAVAGGVLWQLSQPPPSSTATTNAPTQTAATPTAGAAQGRLVILARSDYHQEVHDKALKEQKISRGRPTRGLASGGETRRPRM